MSIKSVVIRKRTIGLVILTLLGVGLIGLGWYSGQVEKLVGQFAGTSPKGNMITEVNNPDGLKLDGLELDNSEQQTTSDFFVEYRLQREKMRGKQVELLREIINNSESSQQTRQKAQEQLLIISNNIKKEMEVENLIQAKGFENSVVFLQEQAVTVIVQADDLTIDQAANVADLVSRGTGVPQKNVVIIPKP